MKAGEKVRKLREERGWSQSELADRAGMNKETVNRFELGGGARVSTTDKLADALGVSKTAIMDDEAEPTDEDIRGYTKDDIPVIAEGDASPQPNLFWDDTGKLMSEVEDRISRPYDVRDPRAYGVRVRGDSMITRLQPGDVAIVSPNTPVADGDEVYAQLLSGERLLKVAHRLNAGWLLESYNRAYEPRPVKRSEIGAMHPIIWIRSKRRGVRVVKEPQP